MNGRIFNIQRFSVNDGPGIRTTVFMKGCNLHCQWCHNPESILPNEQILFYQEKCQSCLSCTHVCPEHIDLECRVKSKRCTHCGACVDACLYGALNVVGEYKTVEEVVAVLEKDMPYYTNSGGGITISGGEALLQVEFIKEIFKTCKQKNIHTALDTAGNVPYEVIQQVLPYVDLFLYDLKVMNSETHKQYTGVENTRILENIKKLLKENVDIHIRVPLIKGVNDSETNLHQMLDVLEGYSNVTEIKLLPYHNMGSGKAAAMDVKQQEFLAPDEEVIRKLEDIITRRRSTC